MAKNNVQEGAAKGKKKMEFDTFPVYNKLAMALPIIAYPNPVLRKKAKSVRTITPEIRKFVKDMVETMYHAKGVGLAATQVGQLLKIVVIDISKDRDQLMVFINPKITKRSKDMDIMAEGCLSVPGYEGDVQRSITITVKTMNLKGDTVSFEAQGFLARAIQHELDHLDGKLYLDCLYGDTGLRPLESGVPIE